MRDVPLLHMCVDNVESPSNLLLLCVQLRKDNAYLVDSEREDATRNQHHERANQILVLIASSYVTVSYNDQCHHLERSIILTDSCHGDSRIVEGKSVLEKP